MHLVEHLREGGTERSVVKAAAADFEAQQFDFILVRTDVLTQHLVLVHLEQVTCVHVRVVRAGQLQQQHLPFLLLPEDNVWPKTGVGQLGRESCVAVGVPVQVSEKAPSFAHVGSDVVHHTQ